jgi:hypothetical protein
MLPSSSYTAADVLTKLKTVDGPGTGLNADVLDTQQGSYYLDFVNMTNKPNPTITLDGDVYATGANANGQVGNGTKITQMTFTKLNNLPPVPYSFLLRLDCWRSDTISVLDSFASLFSNIVFVLFLYRFV